MHAGAADLRGDRPEAAEPAQVELPLRVEAARRAGPLGGKDAIGPDQRSALTLAHQEVVAERVEVVAIEARRAPREACAELVGEHAIAQALRLFHLACARGERGGEARGPHQVPVEVGVLHMPHDRHDG